MKKVSVRYSRILQWIFIPALLPLILAWQNEPNTQRPPIFDSILKFENIWEITSSQFGAGRKKQGGKKNNQPSQAVKQPGFQWMSKDDKDEAHSFAKYDFLGHLVYETGVRFNDDKVNSVTLLLFGRGDSKIEPTEPEFETMRKDVEIHLDQWMGSAGVNAWTKENVTDTKKKSWFKLPFRADLEWAISRNVMEYDGKGGSQKINFRAEFIRVVFTEYDGKESITNLIKPDYSTKAKSTILRQGDLKKLVKRDDNGDTYLDNIPMVNQGQKGYGAVATAERILRYYGHEVDENELAKLANTSIDGRVGTSISDVEKSLKKIGGQFALTYREITPWHWDQILKRLEKGLTDYNRIARQQNAQQIVWAPPAPAARDPLAVYSGYYRNADDGIFLQVLKQPNNTRTKLVADVVREIDNGMPILWYAISGVVKEKNLKSQGGTRYRLIIGYNKKTEEIIYSDPWGAGNESKHMLIDEAAFITGAMSVLAPPP